MRINLEEISDADQGRDPQLLARTSPWTRSAPIVELGDGIARIYGMRGAMAMEMLEFETGVFGLALNLEEDSVGAVILGNYLDLHEGGKVRRTGRVLEVPVGHELIGTGGQPAGHSHRRQGRVEGRPHPAGGVQGARHPRPPVGQGAAADRA